MTLYKGLCSKPESIYAKSWWGTKAKDSNIAVLNNELKKESSHLHLVDQKVARLHTKYDRIIYGGNVRRTKEFVDAGRYDLINLTKIKIAFIVITVDKSIVVDNSNAVTTVIASYIRSNNDDINNGEDE